jgi:hypothetical protein
MSVEEEIAYLRYKLQRAREQAAYERIMRQEAEGIGGA